MSYQIEHRLSLVRTTDLFGKRLLPQLTMQLPEADWASALDMSIAKALGINVSDLTRRTSLLYPDDGQSRD